MGEEDFTQNEIEGGRGEMITNSGSSASLVGLSTDSKPTNVDINTIFLELNTGDAYYFDGTTWQKVGG